MKNLSKLFFVSLIFLCFSCSENIDFGKIDTGFMIPAPSQTSDMKLVARSSAAELPQHYHGYLDWWNTSYDSGQTDTRAAVAVNGDTHGGANMNNRSRTNGVIMSTTDMSVRTGNNINQPHDHGDTGAASNKPPYYAVYMWVRTA